MGSSKVHTQREIGTTNKIKTERFAHARSAWGSHSLTPTLSVSTPKAKTKSERAPMGHVIPHNKRYENLVHFIQSNLTILIYLFDRNRISYNQKRSGIILTTIESPTTKKDQASFSHHRHASIIVPRSAGVIDPLCSILGVGVLFRFGCVLYLDQLLARSERQTSSCQSKQVQSKSCAQTSRHNRHREWIGRELMQQHSCAVGPACSAS